MECSSVVFDEEDNAHTEEQTEAIEFPDTIDEAQHEIANHVNETNDSYGLENISKLQKKNKQNPIFFRLTVNSLFGWLGEVSYLSNSANAVQMPAEFSESWADDC